MQGSTPLYNRSQFARPAANAAGTPQTQPNGQQTPAFHTPYESFTPRRPLNPPQNTRGIAHLQSPYQEASTRSYSSNSNSHPFSQQSGGGFHNDERNHNGQQDQQQQVGDGTVNGSDGGAQQQQQQSGQSEGHQQSGLEYVPSFLTDALLSTQRKRSSGSSGRPRSGGSWSSSPSASGSLHRRRSVSRTPPSSPGTRSRHLSSDDLGTSPSSKYSPRQHHHPSEDDLPPTRSLFAENDYFGSPGDEFEGGSPGGRTFGGRSAGGGFSSSPSAMSDPMALDAAEDLLILPPSSPLLPSPRSFASSLSSSAPDTPTPAPLAASTTVTISGVDEPDVLVDELKRVGRIVACRKGKNWAAVKFEGMAGVKAAMKMNNRLWRDCLLTVKMGDTLNALADVQQQQQSAAQRGREPSRGQQRVAGTALSVPIPIPGAANSSSSSKRASHFAPMDVPPSLPQHPAPKARLIVSSGDDDNEQRQTDNDEDDSAPPTNNTLDSPPSADAWKHAPVSDKKTATSSSATKDKGSKRSNNKPAPLSASHKRPRESDDASALPPSRRTATSNASGGSKAGRRGKDQYSDDEDDVVVRPAGFLATLSDWVFGW